MSLDTPDARSSGSGEAPSLFSAASRAAFRGFLRHRLPDEAAADDVLQQALTKAWETRADTRARHLTGWFYRVLRNAVADFYRERAVRGTRDARYVLEECSAPPETPEEAFAQQPAEPCGCFKPLLAQLRPEYAEILRAADLEGRGPRDAAARLGLTAGNAHVRLHRARGALRERLRAACGACAAHGCLQCTCGAPRTEAGPAPRRAVQPAGV